MLFETLLASCLLWVEVEVGERCESTRRVEDDD